MPRASHRVPLYRHYKPKNLAVVRLHGRDFYLGAYDSPESWRKYYQLLATHLSSATVSDQPREDAPNDLPGVTIKRLCLAYFEFSQGYCQKNGKPTSELDCVRHAIRRLLKLYGDIPANDFGPKALKLVREEFIRDGQARSTVNNNVARIKRLFRWGVENELVTAPVYQALTAVPGLRKGRSPAREPEPIMSVSDELIEHTLRYLPAAIQAMVHLQRLSGCRPGEICLLRPKDIDQSNEVWCYRPGAHKTEHRGHERRIYFGPRAQSILRPWLERDPEAYCFSPAETRANLDARRRAGRKSPRTPSQNRRERKKNPRKSPGVRYTPASYRRAIERACRQAKAPTWSPNQLRHSRATELRKRFGLDGAQVVLGHSEAFVTQIYAEKDFSQAMAIMRECG